MALVVNLVGPKGDKGDKGEKGDIGTIPGNVLLSSPPTGKYRVTNIYVDSLTGKLVVQYDDTPTP